MKTASITCPHPNGTHKMAYVEWGQPSQKPSIICVHGLTRNGRDFDRLAETLEKSSRHILCPDITGRGQSDFLSDPSLYNYGQYIADLTLLLNNRNLKQVDWVGTSMGGLIGMMIAAMPESPIRRLVLNDVGPYIPLAALKRIAAYVMLPTEFADTTQLERYIRQIYAPFGITSEKDWQHMVTISTRKLPNGKLTLAHDPAIGQNFGALDKDLDLWPVYETVKTLTLLLHGETSDVLSAEIAQAMTIRGPRATLITYTGIGHAPALMNQQQITDIENFLSL